MGIDEQKEPKKELIKYLNLYDTAYLPVYDEVFNPRGFITWGSDNLYPQYLIELLNKSAKHRAITETKSQMIGGNEWNKTNLSPTAINFIKNPNSKLDLDEILARVAFDLEVHGSFALNVIWSKDRKSIAQIDYIDVSKVRISVDEKKVEDGYYVCKDWINWRKYKPIKYPKFSTTDRSHASQILYVKTYSPGKEYYTVPSYIGANNWIELEWEVSNYHLSSVQNGFAPAMIINFSQGVPSSEEMQDVVKRLKSEYQGSGNSGKVMITFSDGKDNAPVITPIQLNESDKKFIELNKNITEGIMAGHRVVNPSLFGIKTEGELGGSKDIIDYLNIFTAEYIIPRQKMIEKTFNKLARQNGITEILKVNEFKLDLDVQISTSDILAVLQSNLSDEQKKNVLITIGIQPDEAEKLTKQS